MQSLLAACQLSGPFSFGICPVTFLAEGHAKESVSTFVCVECFEV